MKQVFNLVRQDITTALRDNIVFYMIISPLLLALVVRAFLPAVEATGVTFALSSKLDQAVISELENYGRVELFDHIVGVRDRVERIDAVPGIYEDGGELVLLFEGNEPEEIIEAAQAVLTAVTAEERLVRFEQQSIGEASSMLREIIILSLLMLALFLGGVVSGFNIIDEKDSRAVNAIAVTPLGLQRYLAARFLLALLIAALTTGGTALIMIGHNLNAGLMIVSVGASFFMTAAISLAVGAFAGNQVTAIAVIKVLMPLYLALPIISFFVPRQWQAVFYPLPNYWQFQMLRELLSAGGVSPHFWQSALLTLLLSFIVLIILIRTTRSRLMPGGR